jgi:Hydrolytic ATP binding site of dynein motor region
MEAIDYGAFEHAIKDACVVRHLQPVPGFVTKVIQLYETTVVRHGLMLVGPTGSGKTECYEVLAAALTALKGTTVGQDRQIQTATFFYLDTLFSPLLGIHTHHSYSNFIVHSLVHCLFIAVWGE